MNKNQAICKFCGTCYIEPTRKPLTWRERKVLILHRRKYTGGEIAGILKLAHGRISEAFQQLKNKGVEV